MNQLEQYQWEHLLGLAAKFPVEILSETPYARGIKNHFLVNAHKANLSWQRLFQEIANGWIERGYFALERQGYYTEENLTSFFIYLVDLEKLKFDSRWTPEQRDTVPRWVFQPNENKSDYILINDISIAYFPLGDRNSRLVPKALIFRSNLLEDLRSLVEKEEISKEETAKAESLTRLLPNIVQDDELVFSVAYLTALIINAINREVVTFYCPSSATKVTLKNADSYIKYMEDEEIQARLKKSLLKEKLKNGL